MKYSLQAIRAAREAGLPWREVARQIGAPSTDAAKKFYASYADPKELQATGGTEGKVYEPPPPSEERLLSREDIARILSLEDLVKFFKVDTDVWEVRNFRVNKWEQNSVAQGITPLYQVRADLAPNETKRAALVAQLYHDAARDMQAHAPNYIMPEVGAATPDRQKPCLGVIAIMDPHMGMHAWEPETGNNYDLNIATRDYLNAAAYIIDLGVQDYNVERWLYILGNDMLHIDSMLQGKIGATTAGTPQDFDTRWPKLFSTARQAIVSTIEHARLSAPVDVEPVEGNHDKVSTYSMGEVISAWFRNDERTTVRNTPHPRKYYGYHQNLLGLTHGQEFKRRNRDPLPLVMATEAPEMWARSTCREWLTGHFHGLAELEYMAPRQNISESQGVRVRGLPGLTGWDKWHVDNSFRHRRAATGLFYRQQGGTIGTHEYMP